MDRRPRPRVRACVGRLAMPGGLDGRGRRVATTPLALAAVGVLPIDDRVTPEVDPGRNILAWVIVGVLAVAGLVAFFVLHRRANRRARGEPSTRQQLRGQLNEIVDNARWIQDVGSLEVLRADPIEVRATWSGVRRRMVEIESRIATLAVGTGDPALDQSLRFLAQCVADLRGAEEAYVATKSQGTHAQSRDEQLRWADETLSARRRQLQAAIDPVAFAQQG